MFSIHPLVTTKGLPRRVELKIRLLSLIYLIKCGTYFMMIMGMPLVLVWKGT
jgi:hypothetical protein